MLTEDVERFRIFHLSSWLAAAHISTTGAPAGISTPATVVEKLSRWGSGLPGRGACSFLDGAASWARTTSRVVMHEQTSEEI